jgi:hypothetical protein
MDGISYHKIDQSSLRHFGCEIGSHTEEAQLPVFGVRRQPRPQEAAQRFDAIGRSLVPENLTS